MTTTEGIMKLTLAFRQRLTTIIMYTMFQQMGTGGSNTGVPLSWTAGYTTKANIQSDLN